MAQRPTTYIIISDLICPQLLFQVKDFKKLDSVLQSSNSVAIIGGGFLGSELACALGRKSRI